MPALPFKSLTLAVVAASLAACGGSSADSDGRLTLSLTDAPVSELSKVELTVTGVSLKPASGDTLEFTFDSPQSVDLLQLQGGVTVDLLDNVTVPAGEYNWVRLSLDSDNMSVTEIDGAEKKLRVPSGAETGLKMVRGFTVAQGGASDFTIDFDVRKSVVNPEGNAGGADYLLKPVLRLIDNLQAGAVSGSVDAQLISSACADAAVYSGMVYVFSGADVAADDLGSNAEPLVAVPVSYDSDSTLYRYSAAFLEAGDYSLSYSCDADDNEVDENLTFTAGGNVTVVADETQTVDIAAAVQ